MADVELQKKAQAANRAFNLFKAALRMNGHKMRGDTDYRQMTGLTGLERRLQEEWLDVLEEAEAAAGHVTQPALMEVGAGRAQRRLEAEKESLFNDNSCGLKYRRSYTHVQTGEKWAYMGKEAQEGSVLFVLANESGSFRADETWVKENLNVIDDAPEWDGTLPAEFEGHALEVSAEGLTVKRVSDDRFEELKGMLSAKQLSGKNPRAKEICVISDSSYVVVGSVDAKEAEGENPAVEQALILQTCYPATADETEGRFFKVGRARWKLGSDEDRIMIRSVPCEVIIAEQRAQLLAEAEEEARCVDPLEHLKELDSKNWFRPDSEGARVLELAPRSFEATAKALGRESTGQVGEHLYHADLDLNLYSRAEGYEMPGFEEPENVSAEQSPIEAKPEVATDQAFMIAQAERVNAHDWLTKKGFYGVTFDMNAKTLFDVTVDISGSEEDIYLARLSIEDQEFGFYKASHSRIGGEVPFGIRKGSEAAKMDMGTIARTLFKALATDDA